MPESQFRLTEAQKEAVGQVMADNFGCNFQTGEYGGNEYGAKQGWAYVAWQKGMNWPINHAYVSPDGEVVYD